MANANTTFIAGPATATKMRAHGGAGGNCSSLFPPSIASDVIICGSFTKPPAGIHRQEYSMPSRVQLIIFGPNPIANASTFMPHLRATQKWPNSWTKTAAPKSRMTAAIMYIQLRTVNSKSMRCPQIAGISQTVVPSHRCGNNLRDCFQKCFGDAPERSKSKPALLFFSFEDFRETLLRQRHLLVARALAHDNHVEQRIDQRQAGEARAHSPKQNELRGVPHQIAVEQRAAPNKHADAE